MPASANVPRRECLVEPGRARGSYLFATPPSSAFRSQMGRLPSTSMSRANRHAGARRRFPDEFGEV
jgi:hypothetical protein